jgi:L-2-hydroxyglutarate oxidase LhgO
VIGLACARAIACRGLQTVILESEPTIGSITSSRHSEVIHAGIYYPQYSLKARMCVEGKERLYDYCEDHGVPHKRIGKLIVATSEG